MTRSKNTFDPNTWIQDEVKFLSQTLKTSLSMNQNYYFIYFPEFRLFTFFEKNPFESPTIALPKFIIKVKDILIINFRIAELIRGNLMRHVPENSILLIRTLLSEINQN
jgi:hypothetical protein